MPSKSQAVQFSSGCSLYKEEVESCTEKTKTRTAVMQRGGKSELNPFYIVGSHIILTCSLYRERIERAQACLPFWPGLLSFMGLAVNVVSSDGINTGIFHHTEIPDKVHVDKKSRWVAGDLVHCVLESFLERGKL